MLLQNVSFRVTRFCYQRFMQALLSHYTQIPVGVYGIIMLSHKKTTLYTMECSQNINYYVQFLMKVF